MASVTLRLDGDGDKVYDVVLNNGNSQSIDRADYKKMSRWPAQNWNINPALQPLRPFVDAITQAVNNGSVIDTTGPQTATFVNPAQVAAAAAGIHLNNPSAPAATSQIVHTITVDASTDGAADATVSITLPYTARIVDIELAENSVDLKSRLLTATQLGQKFVDNVGVSGAAASIGIPASTFTGTSLIRRRFAGRVLNSTDKLDLVFHHYAAGKTTIILHLDTGPGGACGVR